MARMAVEEMRSILMDFSSSVVRCGPGYKHKDRKVTISHICRCFSLPFRTNSLPQNTVQPALGGFQRQSRVRDNRNIYQMPGKG